jgi:thymidylate synthase
MSKFEQDYINLVSNVVVHGEHRPSRAGFTVGLFGTALRIDCLEEGQFPILTQRKIFPTGVLGELAAFLMGAEDLQSFKDCGCNYWDANAAAWGPNQGLEPKDQLVGRIYGAQWRNWTGSQGTVDQVERLVRDLQQNPYGRRHLLTTYNPAELEEMCLPPCHLLAQFNVRTTKHLDCVVTMRSVDLCLGLPSDIILYATLLLILCNETGYSPGKITFMMGDSHVYRNHIDKFQEHAQRAMHPLPAFMLSKNATINDFVAADLELLDYNHSGVLNYEFNT